MKRLTTEQILMLHSQLIMTTGGLDGVRDKGLVDSSLSSAFEVYFGVERYPTIEEKAAIVDLGLGAAASELDYEDILEFIQSH